MVLQGLALLMAFGLFSAIYYAHLRTLYSAVFVGSCGALLAYAQLQTPRPKPILACFR
jgi:hypothetical protein